MVAKPANNAVELAYELENDVDDAFWNVWRSENALDVYVLGMDVDAATNAFTSLLV